LLALQRRAVADLYISKTSRDMPLLKDTAEKHSSSVQLVVGNGDVWTLDRQDWRH